MRESKEIEAPGVFPRTLDAAGDGMWTATVTETHWAVRAVPTVRVLLGVLKHMGTHFGQKREPKRIPSSLFGGGGTF